MTNTKSLLLAVAVAAMAFTFSCSGDDGGGGPIKKPKITGVSQKGPFVEGTRVTLYELDGDFAQTGRQFFDIIADNKGTFEIKNVELISPYAALEADGFYRSEVYGQTSGAPIKLYAITDIREKDNVNVNLLTHLEYYRVLNLVESGKTVAEAKKQAQKEILAVFGISGEFKNSEDMSIFGTTEGDAALLAISILLQGDLGEGPFSQRLTNFAQSLKVDGKWDNEAEKNKIADWARDVSFSTRNSSVNSNVNSSFQFCRYDNSPNNCWPMPTYDMCQSGQLVSSCDEERSHNEGQSHNEERSHTLTSIASNILDWGLSSEVPDFGKYVTDYWTTAYGLGACNSSNAGEIKNSNKDVRYICENSNWVVATELEREFYQWVCSASNEGEIKVGNVSNKDYVCKYGIWWEIWQEPGYKEKYCSENICQYFIDSRDNQRYAYVTIGEQTWMAENLNYEAIDSKCYNNDLGNCAAYGRLYNRETANKVCPSGWHLPSRAEWTTLRDYVGRNAGTKLKAKSGWGGGGNGNGTDAYGFSALPGGFGSSDGSFNLVGYQVYWWSASEYESDNDAYFQNMNLHDESIWSGSYESGLFSVRCLQD